MEIHIGDRVAEVELVSKEIIKWYLPLTESRLKRTW